MKYLLSFDPGGTTGFAYLSYELETKPVLIDSGQIPNGHKGFIEWWGKEINKYENFIVVCESFTLRQGVYGVNLEPCYVIGALEALVLPEYQVIYQSPTYKALCDNDALKNLGMYLRGQQHARDAVRHSIAYLRTKELHMPTFSTGWPDADKIK